MERNDKTKCIYTWLSGAMGAIAFAHAVRVLIGFNLIVADTIIPLSWSAAVATTFALGSAACYKFLAR